MSRLSSILLLLLLLPLRGIAADPSPAVPSRGEGAAEVQVITLQDGAEVQVQRFAGGPDRLLWIPAEYGVHEAHPLLAAGIAAGGVEVWLADPHGAWFVAPGRSSYTQVPVAAIAELIERARPTGGRLYLLSAGRGAALTLMAARHWRLEHPQAPPLGGAILLHPNLLANTPQPGEEAQYLPVAGGSNLPIYILQPLNSAKRWHLEGLVARLGEGGSTVYSQLLPGVSDGYQSREDATPFELKARRQLPALISRARRILDRHNRAARTAAAGLPEGEGAWRVAPPEEGLKPYPGSPEAPATRLAGLDGTRYDLAAYRGRVVLLNFWATWCPPCVKEIPSLGRLQQRFAGGDFVVLGADVGETAPQVEAFLARVPAAYPVLLDPEGEMVEPWSLRAFPSTFLVDRRGRIRYSLYGGLEWDAEEVVRLVEGLLAEPGH